MEEMQEKIEDYVKELLHLHDMNIYRNENNKNTMDRIVIKCMDDIRKHEGLLKALENDSQIRYFVRQTILYMV